MTPSFEPVRKCQLKGDFLKCKFFLGGHTVGLPTGLLEFRQLPSIFLVRRFIDMRGIFPSHLSWRLCVMFLTESMLNCLSRRSSVICRSLASYILIPQILRTHLVWNASIFCQSVFLIAQVSHPHSRRFVGMAR